MPHRWLILGLMGMTLSLMACERRAASSSSPPDEGMDEAAPQQVSYSTRFVMNQGAERRAIIAAGEMRQYSRGDSSFAVLLGLPDSLQHANESTYRRVTAWLFTPEGDSSATLTADSLIYFDQRGQFEAFGNARVITPDRKRLRSEYLAWDESDRKIRSNRFVRITTPSERVEGYGLVADENLDTYQIGRFTAQVALDDEGAPADSTQP